jgi:hypothetical protein
MPSSLFFSPQRTEDAPAPAASYDDDDDDEQQHAPHHHPPHQQVVVLDDAPIEAGRVRDFVARGRTLKNTLHPLLAHGQAWVTERQLNARSQTSFVVALPSFIVCASLTYAGHKRNHSPTRTPPLLLLISL